jgi:hypothetical protein
MVTNIFLLVFALGVVAAIADIIHEGYRNERDYRDFIRKERDRFKF